MKFKQITYTIAALFCIIIGAVEATVVSNGNVYIENKEVEAGTSFMVEIHFDGNSQEISSLNIPIIFDDQYLSCTYVDFGGSLLEGGMMSLYDINPGTVDISYIPPVVNPLPAFTESSGLIATLYFTISADAPAGPLNIDSANEDFSFEQFGKTFHQWNRVEMTGHDGLTTYLPTFESGVLTVLRPTDITDNFGQILPTEFAMDQNYPNPFNPSTTISFALPEKTNIRLEIFNLLGQTIAILAEGEFDAGYHQVEWNASEVPSGIYFYKISANSVNLTRKMLFLK